MKRFLPVFLVILIGVAICVPCFADGGFFNYPVIINKNENFNYDIDVVFYYSDSSFTNCVWSHDSNGHAFIGVAPSITHRVSSFRFINNYEYPVRIEFLSSSAVHYSTNVLDIPPGEYREVTSTFNVSTAITNVLTINSVLLDTDYNYSVFDTTGVISNISNMFGFVSASSILPLFLVGVTISLGLVAFRFIRKVMWSR